MLDKNQKALYEKLNLIMSVCLTNQIVPECKVHGAIQKGLANISQYLLVKGGVSPEDISHPLVVLGDVAHYEGDGVVCRDSFQNLGFDRKVRLDVDVNGDVKLVDIVLEIAHEMGSPSISSDGLTSLKDYKKYLEVKEAQEAEKALINAKLKEIFTSITEYVEQQGLILSFSKSSVVRYIKDSSAEGDEIRIKL